MSIIKIDLKTNSGTSREDQLQEVANGFKPVLALSSQVSQTGSVLLELGMQDDIQPSTLHVLLGACLIQLVGLASTAIRVGLKITPELLQKCFAEENLSAESRHLQNFLKQLPSTVDTIDFSGVSFADYNLQQAKQIFGYFNKEYSKKLLLPNCQMGVFLRRLSEPDWQEFINFFCKFLKEAKVSSVDLSGNDIAKEQQDFFRKIVKCERTASFGYDTFAHNCFEWQKKCLVISGKTAKQTRADLAQFQPEPGDKYKLIALVASEEGQFSSDLLRHFKLALYHSKDNVCALKITASFFQEDNLGLFQRLDFFSGINLAALDFSGLDFAAVNPLQLEKFLNLIKTNKQIKALFFADCNLATFLKEQNKVQPGFVLGFGHSLGKLLHEMSMTKLDLSNNDFGQLTSEEFSDLFGTIIRNKSLGELDLTENRFSSWDETRKSNFWEFVASRRSHSHVPLILRSEAGFAPMANNEADLRKVLVFVREASSQAVPAPPTSSGGAAKSFSLKAWVSRNPVTTVGLVVVATALVATALFFGGPSILALLGVTAPVVALLHAGVVVGGATVHVAGVVFGKLAALKIASVIGSALTLSFAGLLCGAVATKARSFFKHHAEVQSVVPSKTVPVSVVSDEVAGAAGGSSFVPQTKLAANSEVHRSSVAAFFNLLHHHKKHGVVSSPIEQALHERAVSDTDLKDAAKKGGAVPSRR